MDKLTVIRDKLRAFIRKYYYNELLKGLILFISLGVLYFLFTLIVEHIFWLEPGPRTFLFWGFIGVELLLLVRFVFYPIIKLLHLSKGLDETNASKIIGGFFPEVGDKLINLLQLGESTTHSELLVASIEQKSRELQYVPFSKAVDFKKSLPYLRYTLIPLVIMAGLLISGESEILSTSYARVVRHQEYFEPPAPFNFHLEEEVLRVRENESLAVKVLISGRSMPENVSVHYGGESYFMKPIGPGMFSYTFENIQEPFRFFFSANEEVSETYSVDVVRLPKMRQLEMFLNYPRHTGMKDERILGTGNATVPEGTVVRWALETAWTDRVTLSLPDTVYENVSHTNVFEFENVFRSSQIYEIGTFNSEVSQFEELEYRIKVIKDAYPELVVRYEEDSIHSGTYYFQGRATDDYGLRILNMMVTPIGNPEGRIVKQMDIGNGLIGIFYAEFPGTFSVQPGKEYEVYFELVDNDAVNGFKKVRSDSYFLRKRTKLEEKEEILQSQSGYIKELTNSLHEDKAGKVEGNISFTGPLERKKVAAALEQQKGRNIRMNALLDKFKKNLSNDENSYNNDLRKELERRVEKVQRELEKNEGILQELEKYSEKIQQEGLAERLKQLFQENQSRDRNLEQLLELTKQYYVREKLSKISREIQELSDKQKELSSSVKGNQVKAQDSLNVESNRTFEDIDKLSQENEDLAQPLSMSRNRELEKNIQRNQREAKDFLEEGRETKAEDHQKKAAEELEILAREMAESAETLEMETMTEDVEMLRQVVDNLIIFSFKQEELLSEFKSFGINDPSFSKMLREQNALKENFEHIDDSIYVLGLRNPVITSDINDLLMDVTYNLDVVLDRFAENQVSQGMGGQQYVMSGANKLAYFLSEKLHQMERMMSQMKLGKGAGGGSGLQLEDIIKRQEELGNKVEQELGRGRKGEDGRKGGGLSEQESEKLFEIYKEQQMIRRSLKDIGFEPNQKDGSVSGEMEGLEEKLLNGGLDKEALERMRNLEQRLLEMAESEIDQGKGNERSSEAAEKQFQNTVEVPELKAKEYFNTTELLNRHALPLRQIYRLKVKEYFGRRKN